MSLKKVKLKDVTTNVFLNPYTETLELLYEWICGNNKCYTNSQTIYQGSLIFNQLGEVITTYPKLYENGVWVIKYNSTKFTLSGHTITVARSLESILNRIQNLEHSRSNRFFNN